MTYKISKSEKSKKLSIIFFVLFFVLIIFISSILISSKKKNICFEARRFFIVYAEKSRDKNSLINVQEQIKKQGGAGVFLEKNNEYYVAVAGYNNKDSANEVLKNISNKFVGGGVLELSCKSASLENKNLMHKNREWFELVNVLYKFLFDYESWCFDYVSGIIGEGEFMSRMVVKKLEIQSIVERCKQNIVDDIKSVLDFADLKISLFEKLFDKFYGSNNKEHLCFEFFVLYINSYIKLFDYLK